MPPLPRNPGPRVGLRDQVDYLQEMAAFLGDAALSILQGQRTIIAMTETFQGDLDRNTADTKAIGDAVLAEIAKLAAAIAQLSTSTPPTQAQLDQLNASSTALEAATASLTTPPAPPAA